MEECCVCKQPIKGDCIESGKKFYHPGCMRCFVCGDALRGQYFTYEGEPICERDYKVSHMLDFAKFLVTRNFCFYSWGRKNVTIAASLSSAPVTPWMKRTTAKSIIVQSATNAQDAMSKSLGIWCGLTMPLSIQVTFKDVKTYHEVMYLILACLWPKYFIW